MNIYIKKCFQNHHYHVNLQILRHLTSQEVSTALRPFYFVVHPDLFNQYPQQRKVNEDSLKHLSEHLEALLHQHLVLQTTPRELPFYIRPPGGSEDRGKFNLIRVPLVKTVDTKSIIKKILETCKLPTDYVDQMKTPIYKFRPATPNTTTNNATTERPNSRYTQWKNDCDSFDDDDILHIRMKKARKDENLKDWLHYNYITAKVRKSEAEAIQFEVEKLRSAIQNNLKLKGIIYDCGWNVGHFLGCLRSLEKIAKLHPDCMKHLKGRTLSFAEFTGISLDGHVMLFTGDVPTNWLEFLKNIPKHDAYLGKIPAYEFALSQVLRKIRIGRRKFMPKSQAMLYAEHLSKITTTLLDYLSRSKYPKSWPDDLSEYELVVESEAGPMMVNPTGQLIVPSTCPGSILVDFFSNHLQEALEKERTYQTQKYIEKDLFDKCIKQFELHSLIKDDSVTPDRMILCLQKILQDNELELKDVILNVTTYYSVLADGTVCIPWDWKK